MLHVNNSYVEFPGDGCTIVSIWPAHVGDTPENIPANVERFYAQGVQSRGLENWDAAGAMFRKTLDVATKIIDPDLGKTNLFARINSLAVDGKITNDLALWAHEIRIDGNDAVHGEEPETKGDVEAVHQFCRSFLLYTFTLPHLVAFRQANRTEQRG